MRRGVGLSGIQREQEARQSFQQKAHEIQQYNKESLSKLQIELKTKLESFMQGRRAELIKNPLMLSKFRQMCILVGVDPLMSARQKGYLDLIPFLNTESKHNYYNEVAVQLVETCMLLRNGTGGLVDLKAVQKRVERVRGGVVCSEQDVIEAIKCLEPLSSGYKIISIDSIKYILSVPMELCSDDKLLFSLARRSNYIDLSIVTNELKWIDARFKHAVTILINRGILWVDDFHGETKYWFACQYIK